jgi:heme/copper-type cytochrome/quinol oxidase subunit 2
MEMNFLTIMAYLIVVITLITMIFGIIAYSVYKLREAKRATVKKENDEKKTQLLELQEKYLFFEQKELII